MRPKDVPGLPPVPERAWPIFCERHYDLAITAMRKALETNEREDSPNDGGS